LRPKLTQYNSNTGVSNHRKRVWFNEYPYFSTNTHSFNDYFGTKYRKIIKTQKNRCGNTPQRGLLYVPETAKALISCGFWA